jgi:hypothetical protein
LYESTKYQAKKDRYIWGRLWTTHIQTELRKAWR